MLSQMKSCTCILQCARLAEICTDDLCFLSQGADTTDGKLMVGDYDYL